MQPSPSPNRSPLLGSVRTLSIDRSPKLSELEARIAVVNEQLRTAQLENEALKHRSGVQTPGTYSPTRLRMITPKLTSPLRPLTEDDEVLRTAKAELVAQVKSLENELTLRDDISSQRAVQQVRDVRVMEDQLQDLEAQLIAATSSVLEKEQLAARRLRDVEEAIRANARLDEEMRQRVAEFQKSAREIQKQIDPLQAQKAILQEEVDALKTKKSRSQHVLKHLSAEVFTLSNRDKELSGVVEEQERQFVQNQTTFAQQVQRLNRRIQELQGENGEASEINKALQLQIEQRRAYYRSAQDDVLKELDDAGLRLAEAREMVRVLAYEQNLKDQRDASAEMERQKKHLEETKAVAADRAEAVARAKRESDVRLRDVTKEKDEIIASLQSQLTRLQIQAQRQTEENTRQSQTLQTLNRRLEEMTAIDQQNASLSEQNQNLADAAAALAEESARLQSNVQSLKTSLTQRVAELQNAKLTLERMNELNKKISETKRECVETASALATVEDRIQTETFDATRRHEQSIEQFEGIQSNIANTQREMNKMTEKTARDVDTLNRKALALRSQISDAEGMLNLLSEENITKQNTILRYTEEINRLEREKQERTKAAIEAAKAVVCELSH